MTGASGHVGGTIADSLACDGHDVLAVSRRLLHPESVGDAVAADISNRDAVEDIAARPPCDAIVHAAAAIDADPQSVRVSQVNCVGTQNIHWLAERWAVRGFVFISSLPVVGAPRVLPVDEEHPLDPPTAYHASKLFGERLTGLSRRRGVAASSLRLTSPVGPGMPAERICSVFVSRAVTGEPLEVAGRGTRAQDYVDVRDVAAAVAGCLRAGAVGTFNVASGRAITNDELARACVELLGSDSEVRLKGEDDPEEGIRWEVSIERARQAFGYAPRFSLADSVLAVAEGEPTGVASTTSKSPRREELRKKSG